MESKQLRQLVINELDFEPSIDASNIGVQAHDGVVTLTGHVTTVGELQAAERAAWRIKGVRAVASEIEVRPRENSASDEDIAKRALGLLRWDSTVPETVRVRVHQGWVTLEGHAQWQFQRTNAEKDLRQLSGLTGITNDIAISTKQPVDADDVKCRIQEALERNAHVEAERIRVGVDPAGTVTLQGQVGTWVELMAVEHAAWSAPGVRAVVDHLKIAQV